MNKFFLRILNNFTRPHKIPIKIFNKINYHFKYKKYNQNVFDNKQNKIFNYFGLNREEGIKNLNLIKENSEFNMNKNREMSSEHEVIFSSLSLNQDQSTKNILEIGTFDGFNALLLSHLFPDSKIDTIDLHENDEDYINFYNRKNKIEEFVQKRNSLLLKNNNINFIPLNSLKLLNHKNKYDLIWIDGAHGYPVVCMDIINSLHILKEKGFIICDDVNKNINSTDSDKMYDSIASYETLKELEKQKLIDFKLVYKRISPEFNCVENKRMYIAIIKKIDV